jgi:hypothetical protein
LKLKEEQKLSEALSQKLTRLKDKVMNEDLITEFKKECQNLSNRIDILAGVKLPDLAVKVDEVSKEIQE